MSVVLRLTSYDQPPIVKYLECDEKGARLWSAAMVPEALSNVFADQSAELNFEVRDRLRRLIAFVRGDYPCSSRARERAGRRGTWS
jgi:hypothetical protein